MILKPNLFVPRPKSVSKYLPHQSTKECKRRLKQIASRQLQGECVTMAARYTAIGLTDPTDPYFIKGT